MACWNINVLFCHICNLPQNRLRISACQLRYLWYSVHTAFNDNGPPSPGFLASTSRNLCSDGPIEWHSSRWITCLILILFNILIQLALLRRQFRRYVSALGLFYLKSQDRGSELKDLVLDLAALFFVHSVSVMLFDYSY